MIPRVQRVSWRGWAGCAMVASLLVAGCSAPEQGQPDPLKNTRKLVTEGHKSLYDNGAFTVPFTKLKLIPPGPTKEELLFEMALPSARDAFLLNLAEAQQVYQIVSDGTQYSFELATEIHEGTSEIIAAIRSHARPQARLIAHRSYLQANGIRGKSYEISERAESALERWGRNLESVTAASGDRISATGEAWVQASPALAEAILVESGKMSGQAGSALSESADELRQNLTRKGDALVLSGVSRLGTSPQTLKTRVAEADRSATAASANVREAGRTLAKKGSAAGEERTERGMALAGTSGVVAGGIYQGSARMADSAASRMESKGRRLKAAADKTGEDLARRQTRAGGERVAQSLTQAGAALDTGMAQARVRFDEAGETFVIGYAAVPEKVSGHMAEIQPGRTLDEFSKRAQAHGEWREQRSSRFSWLISDTLAGYADGVALKLKHAGEVFDDTLESSGVSLASLKAMRWVVEALLWDGVVEPVGKLSAGVLGYLAVNGVAYPALVTYEGAWATAHIAAQVTVGTAKSGWEIVAPSGQAALAGMLGIANAGVAVGESSAIAGGGTLAGTGQATAGQVAGALVRTAGTTADIGLRYVAVPITHAGLRIGGGTAAAAAGSVLLVAGGSQAALGQTQKGVSLGVGTAMEHVGAPVTGAAIRTGGAAGGVVEGVVDEVTGATLVATGGVVKGTALATEAAIKYGVSPVTQTAVAGGGLVGSAAAGAGKAAGGGTVYLWGRVVKGSGWVAGNTLEHVGAPVTMAGIVAVGEVSGGATRSGGELAESVTLMAGEAAAGTTWLFGNTVAGGVLAGGTTVSVAYGGAVGLYEISSAMVVPVGHIGGAGIVLSYKSISHLAAHSVLAVADASYLVLSLEGPRWVLYAVKGDLNDGSEIAPGAMLDLKAMQENGEVFYNVPVSDEEVQEVVSSMAEDLPAPTEPEADSR